jgi:hypothetical protein
VSLFGRRRAQARSASSEPIGRAKAQYPNRFELSFRDSPMPAFFASMLGGA